MSSNSFLVRSARLCSDPAVFVMGVWLVMVVGAFSFLARFAVNVPYAEDGMLIPYVTKAEHLNLKFLWTQYSTHIIPLPKLVLYLLTRSTRDFRTAMYVSVLLCSAIALALAWTARAVRGRFDYSDAFFAIGLLHLGHWESFLLGFAIQEVMSTTFLAIILAVILRSGATLTRRQALLAGLCLVLLPTTGTAGFLVVPPLAAWLAYSARISWRSGASATAILQLALVLIALALLTPYYFSLPHGEVWAHPPAGLAERARTYLEVLLQVLTLAFGSSAAESWFPFSDKNWPVFLVGPAVLALLLIGLIVLLRRNPATERLRGIGLLLFLVANMLVLCGIALGRGGYAKTSGLSPRYSLYSVPLLWGLYFTWQMYGSQLSSRLVPLGLFAFMCALFPLNMQLGLGYGSERYSRLKSVESDIVKSEVSAVNVAITHYRCVSGTHWACYRLGGRGDSEVLICYEMSNMVSMLRQANIPKRNHP